MLVDSTHAKSIFMEAAERPPGEPRQAYLAESCGRNDALRREVDDLLAHFERVGSFLENPAAAPTMETPSTTEVAGTVIGSYKLLEPIGEGGFGVVFLAEQTAPVRRKVALKVIKPGMDSRQVVARFEAERQALALMDHPNIAKVFDGGTTQSGRPYFVMELVKGVPITDFCDQNQLTPRQRLELFLSVCQAVQHAHQKGIIHRDLKPSNILVVIHDTTPVVKVIDFGVAKALGQELTEKTVFTGFAQMVGTPLYMSPEQAGQSGLDVDTRSDIYSLGVLLYELLTGMTPFSKERFSKAAYEEIRRIIREEEPPKPSTRLSQATETLTSVSTHRQTEPAKLSKLVRGELDWIVMKALEKDRARRYETANGFAQDIQRYLADDAVQACPPTAGYRLRKFARRNKRVLATAAVLSAMVLVAVPVLAVSYFRTSQALQDRQQALDREKQAKEDLELTAYIQRIQLAGRELGDGNVGHAEQLLEECPERLRGWEWHFLKRQRYESPLSIPHSETVVRVAFSQDGRQIASARMGGVLAVWDAGTGRPLPPLEQQAGSRTHRGARSIAYSRDGRYLAVVRRDGHIHVWDPTSGKLLHTLEGHQGICWKVAFSPDSRTLASGGEDRSLRLWDMASGKVLQPFPIYPAEVKAVAFRPDGESVLAACEDGTVHVWDLRTERTAFSFQADLEAHPSGAWFSPDARRLAWSCRGGVIKIWNTTTGVLEINQQSDTHQCRAVAFSPDGRRIALAGFDSKLRLLDASTGKEMLTIFAHASQVADVAFSPDGQRLASTSYDNTVRIWDATPLTSDTLPPGCVTLLEQKQPVNGVAVSPNGRWLAAANEDGTVPVWEIVGGAITPRYTIRGHRESVVGVAFSSDSRTLVSGSLDNTVKLWDLHAPVGDSLLEIRPITCRARVHSVALSPDRRFLAVGQQKGIALYDPATGNEVAPFKETPNPVPAVTFSPDSRWLISAGASDPAIKIWEVAGEEPTEIRHYSNPNASVAISSDGKLIASPARDHAAGVPAVKIWDAQSHETLHTLKGHLGYVWKVAFSPDGRYLASGSWDSTIKIWDLTAPDGTEPVTLRGHAGIIHGLAFSPDGQRLASASGSARYGEVKVWDAKLWNAKENGRR